MTPQERKSYIEAQQKLNKFWASMAALVESTPMGQNATHSNNSDKELGE